MTLPDNSRIDATVYEKVRTVSYGAVLTILSHGTRRFLMLVTNLVLTRGLAPVLYSSYALCWRLIDTLKIFVPLGADATVVRDGARSTDRSHRSATAGLAYPTTLFGGFLIGLLAYGFAPLLNRFTLNNPELLLALKVTAVILPFAGIIVVNGHFLRSLEEVERILAVKDIGWPLARLVLVAPAVYLGYELVGVVGAVLVATVLLGVLGMVYALWSTNTSLSVPTWKRMRSFYNHALPRALSKTSTILRVKIYIFLVGMLVLEEIAAGQFNVVLLLSGLASIPLMGFNKLLPPIAADLYSTDRTNVLNDVYAAVTRLITTLTLPGVTLIVVFGREILSLFGPNYVPAYGALIIVLMGRTLANCVGATGWLLLMTDNQYPQLYLDWILALINLPMSYVLITEWGLPGAALGYALQNGLQNLLQLGILRKVEGLLPWGPRYWKPLLAIAAMIPVLMAFKLLHLAAPLGIALGVLMGLLTYGLVLFVLGFEPLDRAVVRGLWEGMRSVVRNPMN